MTSRSVPFAIAMVLAELSVAVFATGGEDRLAARLQSHRPVSNEPAFDVVSIKRAVVQAPPGIGQLPDGTLILSGLPTRWLIGQAYPHLQADIVGLPGWADTERYDVIAKSAPGTVPPTGQQRAAMLRRLLESRYSMVAHVETRQAPVFNLVVARQGMLGPNLRPSSTDCIPPSLEPQPLAVPETSAGQTCRLNLVGNRFEGETTMPSFANTLRVLVGRPVIDKTGLPGVYHIAFESSAQPFTRATVPGSEAIETALQRSLGLRLESGRSDADVLVIERLERPTEN